MSRAHATSHVLVATQMLAIVGCLYAPGLEYYGSAYALSISAAGALLALWVLYHNRPGNFGIYPEPGANTKLITHGPYQWLRHPMYSSLFLLMLGPCLYSYQLSNAIAIILLACVIYIKAGVEERYLGTRFTEYQDYQQHTWRFIPFLL